MSGGRGAFSPALSSVAGRPDTVITEETEAEILNSEMMTTMPMAMDGTEEEEEEARLAQEALAEEEEAVESPITPGRAVLASAAGLEARLSRVVDRAGQLEEVKRQLALERERNEKLRTALGVFEQLTAQELARQAERKQAAARSLAAARRWLASLVRHSAPSQHRSLRRRALCLSARPPGRSLRCCRPVRPQPRDGSSALEPAGDVARVGSRGSPRTVRYPPPPLRERNLRLLLSGLTGAAPTAWHVCLAGRPGGRGRHRCRWEAAVSSR